MKLLNLYAGIGGNRKLWNEVVDDLEVTAVEIDEEIAEIYGDNFPSDRVVLGDAHKFLKENYEDYDFIWSSPPCPTHSRTALFAKSDDKRRGHHKKKPKYPNMELYEEIIFLDNFFEGLYCVENVISYYKPLIEPQKIQRHFFWANFYIPPINLDKDNYERGSVKEWEERFGFDLSGYNGIDKRKVIRNCVHPKLGKHILKSAFENKVEKLEAFC